MRPPLRAPAKAASVGESRSTAPSLSGWGEMEAAALGGAAETRENLTTGHSVAYCNLGPSQGREWL